MSQAGVFVSGLMALGSTTAPVDQQKIVRNSAALSIKSAKQRLLLEKQPNDHLSVKKIL